MNFEIFWNSERCLSQSCLSANQSRWRFTHYVSYFCNQGCSRHGWHLFRYTLLFDGK